MGNKRQREAKKKFRVSVKAQGVASAPDGGASAPPEHPEATPTEASLSEVPQGGNVAEADARGLLDAKDNSSREASPNPRGSDQTPSLDSGDDARSGSEGEEDQEQPSEEAADGDAASPPGAGAGAPESAGGAGGGGGDRESKLKARARMKLEKLKRKKKLMAKGKNPGAEGGQSGGSKRAQGLSEGGEADASGKRKGVEGTAEGDGGAKRRREDGSKGSGSVHPLRMKGRRPGEACFECQQAGHSAKDCPVKQRRVQQEQGRKVCLLCRQRGHSMQACPDAAALTVKAEGAGPSSGPPEGRRGGGAGEFPAHAAGSRGKQAPVMCYNCGQGGHHRDKCPLPLAEGGAQHAVCFVCRQPGHLSRDCPDNPHGLYPKGGACKKCGQKTHLAKDCPMKRIPGMKAQGEGGGEGQQGGSRNGSTQGRKSGSFNAGPHKRFSSGDALDDDFGDLLLQPMVKRKADAEIEGAL